MKKVHSWLVLSLSVCSGAGLGYACTAGTIHGNATADGRPIFFKVRDTSIVQQQFNFFFYGTYSYIGVYSKGGVVTTGQNEAGLVTGSTRSRVEEEGGESYFRNSEFTRHILSNYSTLDEVQALMQRQVGYDTGEFDKYISGNYPSIDRAGRAVLYEMYKPDLSINTDTPFLYVYDTTNLNRQAQGMLNMVLRTGFFHQREDGTDDVDSGRRYESARYNMTGLLGELGAVDLKTIMQGNVREEGVRIIGLEMGTGGSRRPGATAYFVPPEEPVSLSSSEVIRLTAKVLPKATVGSEADGFRMVLARSGGSRMVEDDLHDVTMSGYMITYNPFAGTYSFRRRSQVSGVAVSDLNHWAVMGSGAGQLTMQKNGAYTVTMELERLPNGTVQLRFIVDNGSSSKTVSFTDTQYKFTDFDTAALSSANSYGLVRMEEINVIPPSGNGLLGDRVRWYRTEHVNDSTRPIEAEPGNFEVIRYGPMRSLRGISRHDSMSTMVVQGVLPDEDPALTTSWVMLGNPGCTIAVPAWVRAGDTIHSSLKQGAMWDRARSLYLKRADLGVIQASLFPAEAHLLDMVNRVLLPHWRDYGTPAPEEMARVHQQMAEDAYSLLNCLDSTREDNRAPVVGDLQINNERGSPVFGFSVDADDPDGEIVSYAWQFGDGAVSADAEPWHTYNVAGHYLVSCTVTDHEGVSITGWSYVQVRMSQPVPYEQDFEIAEGSLPGGFEWQPGPGDQSRVIPAVYTYDGVLPLPGRPHTRVLEFDSGDSVLSVDFSMEENQFPFLYLDQMVWFVPGLGKPSDVSTRPDLKTALYMNPDGNLVLFHGGADGETGTFTVLDGRFTPGTWRRITWVVDSGGPDEVPFFQMLADGEAQSGTHGQGFGAPRSVLYTGGPWFRFANYSSQREAGTHRVLNWAGVRGVGKLDDVILTGEDPSPPPRKTYLIRSYPGPGGTAIPSVDLAVKSGDYISILYQADPFHTIQTLTSNGQPLSSAAGTEQYEWEISNVSGAVSNQIVFVAEIWNGDGVTPLWWADERGYTDGTALSMNQGYLLNQENLEAPFELIEIGVNGDQKVFVKWFSSGAAHGTVRVRSAAGLTDPAPWLLVDGTVVHENGSNTWTSSEASDSKAFYRVVVTTE